MKSEIISKKYIDQLELLSPVGDWDCLLAAVQNGADAVYLGIKEFNARLNTRNFTLEELNKVVKNAHGQGVRVYLTLNTLVKNNELKHFFEVLSQAYSCGIDGVIVQHISFLELIKRNFPGLAVFMSTQAAIGNPSSALLVKTADRIILPRELNMSEIQQFTARHINTEVFIHGALCFSYSGLCLFSSFVSSRSGNRGSCAQLCRQKYNQSYPLSTKELCTVQRIPELIKAGVKGFKIEGRMRSPLYVAVATRLYRKAIDSFLNGNPGVPQQEMADMEVVFSREFTSGFIGEDTDFISPEKPMNRGAYLGTARNGRIVVQREVSTGDGIGIWQDGEVTGAIIKTLSVNGKPVSAACEGETIDPGLEIKDGSKIYLTSSPHIPIQPGVLMSRYPIKTPVRDKVRPLLPAITAQKSNIFTLLVKTYSLAEARLSAQAGANIVFLNIFSPDFPEKTDWEEEAGLGAYLPRIMNETELAAALDLLRTKKPGAVLTGNLGFLPYRKEFKVPVYADYSLNIFNDMDIYFYKQHNVVPVMSPELTLNELSALKNKNVAIFCHGDIILVNSKINPGAPKLVDEKGAIFPVRQEKNYWQILNSRPFGIFNDISKLRAVDFNQFYIDRQDRGPETVKLYRAIIEYGFTDRKMSKGYTSGHLYKPVA